VASSNAPDAAGPGVAASSPALGADRAATHPLAKARRGRSRARALLLRVGVEAFANMAAQALAKARPGWIRARAGVAAFSLMADPACAWAAPEGADRAGRGSVASAASCAAVASAAATVATGVAVTEGSATGYGA
jgi:hypothetical protein